MQNETSYTPLRVLVIEDCPDTATTMAMLLRLWGHDVQVAADGPDGLAIARSYQPDIVLLDIGLPHMDGYQVACRLREQVGLHHAVLVSVSGYAEERDRRRSWEAGCDSHLIKPVEPAMLRRLLNMWREWVRERSAEPVRGTT